MKSRLKSAAVPIDKVIIKLTNLTPHCLKRFRSRSTDHHHAFQTVGRFRG